MSGSLASLSTLFRTFLHLSPTCLSIRPTPARLPRLMAEVSLIQTHIQNSDLFLNLISL